VRILYLAYFGKNPREPCGTPAPGSRYPWLAWRYVVPCVCVVSQVCVCIQGVWICVYSYVVERMFDALYRCEDISPSLFVGMIWTDYVLKRYGVATISRLLKIISLFCRISSLLWGSFTKETYEDIRHSMSAPSMWVIVYVDTIYQPHLFDTLCRWGDIRHPMLLWGYWTGYVSPLYSTPYVVVRILDTLFVERIWTHYVSPLCVSRVTYDMWLI